METFGFARIEACWRDLRAEYVGPDTVHAGMRIEVTAEMRVEEAAAVAAKVHRRVHENGRLGYCFIQIEPAGSLPHARPAVAHAEIPMS